MATAAGASALRPPRALDEETIDLMKARIGIPTKSRGRPHNEFATSDSMRHFARGYGDDNPLYGDADYAAGTVWGGLIAPPMFPMSSGSPVDVNWTPEQARAMSGGDPLAGMGQYMCGERSVFLRPIRVGARITRSQSLDAADLKHSAFGGGVGALVSHRAEYVDSRDGGPVSYRFIDFWHAERDKSRETGKYRNVDRHHYTLDELAEFDALYENEQVRGSTPRLWEDVSVGDSLGTIAKGPITLTDMLTYTIAIGWGGFGGGTSKIAYQSRRKIPKFYVPNEFGIPDTVQRCHWEDAWAQQLGHPAAYDYGAMRTNWMIHLITNWIGDAGWLWKLSSAVMKFNYLGDAHRVSGEVVAKRQTATTAEVDVAVRGVNQRGETTCSSTATILLPTAQRPTVEVPAMADTVLPPAEAPTRRSEVNES